MDVDFWVVANTLGSWVASIATCIAAYVAWKALDQWKEIKRSNEKTEFKKALSKYKAKVESIPDNVILTNPGYEHYKEVLKAQKIQCDKYWFLSAYSDESQENKHLEKLRFEFDTQYFWFIDNQTSKRQVIEHCTKFISRLKD